MPDLVAPTRSKYWDEPLTSEKLAEIRQEIAQREPVGCAYVCVSTPDRFTLILPLTTLVFADV